MHAGLYDDNPRAKPNLSGSCSLIAQLRGLAALYVPSQMNSLLEQAGHFHSEWTPRGWAVANDKLTGFEQLLYLRQPGYGTSYIIGKLPVRSTSVAEYSAPTGARSPTVCVPLTSLLIDLNNDGMIPIALIEDELISKKARLP